MNCPSCGSAEFVINNPCPDCGHSISPGEQMETVQQFFTESGRPLRPKKPVACTIGEVFGERYRVDALLGRGGMGSVYRVFDLVDKEERALKILHEGASEGEGAERFLREVEILSRIDHPSVLRVFAWGGQDTQLYFVAEYVEGDDLRKAMMNRPHWPAEEAAQIGGAVAEGLGEAHKLSIVHRDVKPHNIILADDGTVKLLDFGVARARVDGMPTLTKTGMVLGTPEYMSPEQFEGKKVEPPSDVYSLGVILYQMLTGELPFVGNRMEIAIRVLTETVVPPRLCRDDVPVWLDHIVMKCLQRDMKKRYSSAVELAADLKSPRQPGKLRMTWLAGGDGILEDPAGAWEWDLVLSSFREKPDWEIGMALRFSGLLYRLVEKTAPTESMRRWNYHFRYWPNDGIIIQRVTNYDPEKKA